MKIDSAIQAFQQNLMGSQDKQVAGGDEGFATFLSDSFSNVNSMLAEADKKAEGMVTGEVTNMHEAMIAFEKADVALKLLVQVRNKAIEAYNQVSQMQV